MSRFFAIILASFLLASPLSAQTYKKRQILKDLNTLEGFENAFIGFVLYDTEKGKVVAKQNADKHMTPASVTKLFTAYAALEYLPEDLTAAEYVIHGDSLIFWSTGYPLTLHPDHRDSTLIDFLSKSDKQIFYWPRDSADDRFGPGWAWDDYLGYYGAEKSLFPIYGNAVQFIINNDNQTFQYSPKHQGIKVSIDTTNSERSRVKRDEFWNEYIVQFGSESVDTLLSPYRYSDRLFIEFLEQESSKEIDLIEDFKKPEEYLELIGVKRDSLLKWMLQPSDNLFAEQLMAMIGGYKYNRVSVNEGIFQAVQEYGQFQEIEKNNLSYVEAPLEALTSWRDGSGLTRYNMFKPIEILRLLQNLDLNLAKELLPKGQTSGTLKDWYSPAIYAKTGTLSNNHSLAGYIEAESGKTMIFVIMANHYIVPTTKSVNS